MRKETSNQFTEGLVSDLNPITTPNTVLTDNLNGTIITYNGNEFSLQNDQGNYELKHCRLKPNYIPVGIKEYGDILYIVSYNPLDKHVEIGSYPSPLQVNEVEPNNTDAELVSIIDSEILNKGLLEKDYSELVKKEQQVIFNGDEFKMYPGDEYYFQTDNIDSPYYYEKFEYFILDEESNLHDITPEIQYGQSDPIFSDYKYVSWRIPGWLIAKARLARLSSAGMNIRSFYAPLVDVTTNTRTVFYDFNFRLNIEDYILKDAESKYRFLWEKNIGFKVIFTAESPEGNVVKINGKDEYIIESFEPSCSEWYGDNYILWFSEKGQFDISGDSVIKVTLIPELTQYNENKQLYTIVYDNLSQTEIFDLRKVNDKQWDLGDSTYKFYINNKTKQSLEFDVVGPNVASGYVTLQYQILSIDGQSVIDWADCNEYYGIGNNYINIPFTDQFEKENIYTIQFRFVEDGSIIKTSPKRIIFTTELLNGSENFVIYDRDMSLEYLITLYLVNLKNHLNVSYEIMATSDVTVTSDEWLRKFLNSNLRFNTFVDITNLVFNTKAEVGFDITYKIGDISFFTGIWKDILETEIMYNGVPLNDVVLTKHHFKLCDIEINSNSEQFNFANLDNVCTLSDFKGRTVTFDVTDQAGNEYDFFAKVVVKEHGNTIHTEDVWFNYESAWRLCTSGFHRTNTFVPSFLNRPYYTTKITGVFPNFYFNNIFENNTTTKVWADWIVFPSLNLQSTNYAVIPIGKEVGDDPIQELTENIKIVYDTSGNKLTSHQFAWIKDILSKPSNDDVLCTVNATSSSNWIEKINSELNDVLFKNCIITNKVFTKDVVLFTPTVDYAKVDEYISNVKKIDADFAYEQYKEWNLFTKDININTDFPSGAYTSNEKLKGLCEKITLGIKKEILDGDLFGFEGETSAYISIATKGGQPILNVIDIS